MQTLHHAHQYQEGTPGLTHFPDSHSMVKILVPDVTASAISNPLRILISFTAFPRFHRQALGPLNEDVLI